LPEVVAVKSDVEFAVFNGSYTRNFEQALLDAVSECHTTWLNAYEAGICEGVVIFNQLMTQPVNG